MKQVEYRIKFVDFNDEESDSLEQLDDSIFYHIQHAVEIIDSNGLNHFVFDHYTIERIEDAG